MYAILPGKSSYHIIIISSFVDDYPTKKRKSKREEATHPIPVRIPGNSISDRQIFSFCAWRCCPGMPWDAMGCHGDSRATFFQALTPWETYKKHQKASESYGTM
jgi:hypothetical protein